MNKIIYHPTNKKIRVNIHTFHTKYTTQAGWECIYTVWEKVIVGNWLRLSTERTPDIYINKEDAYKEAITAINYIFERNKFN